jgi:hypothetical protein
MNLLMNRDVVLEPNDSFREIHVCDARTAMAMAPQSKKKSKIMSKAMYLAARSRPWVDGCVIPNVSMKIPAR